MLDISPESELIHRDSGDLLLPTIFIKNKKEQHPAKPDSQALNPKHGVKWLSDIEKFFSATHAQRRILLVNPCTVREA
ncbi:hypothetical protein [Comamonas jiangduensis]|uniref:hypothetical protein n=1 Tax=Comamonas jiangduensis TaxID=1194168 RepID=UPI0028A9F486|nr:hypothetical protein [Comamonas jiangduensis]